MVFRNESTVLVLSTRPSVECALMEATRAAAASCTGSGAAW
jgi:hypothetical protein